MMGCDIFANEEGVIEIVLFDWKSSKELGRLRVEDLAPGQEASWDVFEGDER